MKNLLTITIDGPSASGKSSVAKKVAKRLGFKHLDTGAIYRSIAWWLKNLKISLDDKDSMEKALNEFDYEMRFVKDGVRHFVNGEEITELIRTEEIAGDASKIATIPFIRDKANFFQREIAKLNPIVVEGRDAGTIVFPDAEIKVYLTASIAERAKRRMHELEMRYPHMKEKLKIDDLMEEISKRDDRDLNRKVSPLRRALDATTIDTTDLTLNQVVKKVVKEVKRLIKREHPNRIWKWLLTENLAKSPLLYRIGYLLCRGFFRLFYRLKVYGAEKFPEGAAIIAPNHVSFIDPPAIGASCPTEIHFLAQEYLFHIPVLKWFLKRTSVHPISSQGEESVDILKLFISLLKKGHKVMIFPEGSRSRSGKLLPLKRGVAMIAFSAKAPIVPTVIEGAYEIWPRGKKFPKPWGRISVKFGDPIYPEDYLQKCKDKKEAQLLFLEDLAKAMLEMQNSRKK